MKDNDECHKSPQWAVHLSLCRLWDFLSFAAETIKSRMLLHLTQRVSINQSEALECTFFTHSFVLAKMMAMRAPKRMQKKNLSTDISGWLILQFFCAFISWNYLLYNVFKNEKFKILWRPMSTNIFIDFYEKFFPLND